MASAKLLLAFVLAAVATVSSRTVKEDFNLNIVHVNDLHAHFDAFNKNGLTCSEDEFAAKQCYGGFPRLITKVKELLASSPNSIFLNAGDFFQGTLYYSLFKGDVVREMGNLMDMTAFALGNHEFDDGVPGLLKLTGNATFPILACNVDASADPEFAATIKKSVTVTIGGRKVGIIGYITENTPILSSPGEKMIFLNEVESIQAEATRLTADGVNIIIATGHAGYDKDKEIAEKVKGVDLVVGAHSHSFLWPEDLPLPTDQLPVGPYPTTMNQVDGSTTRKVPVVQAYAYGKYVGHFRMNFDDNGEQTSFEGQPLLIDQNIAEDPAIIEALAPYSSEVQAEYFRYVGKSNVFLNASGSMEESNMGNLITDAMVDWLANKNVADPLDDTYEWTRAAIAVNNDGGIRASIDDQSRGGNITAGDIRSVIPFENDLVVLEMPGKTLRQALEHSVKETSGAFLQVSGLQVNFDTDLEVGRRAVQVYAKCQKCRVPVYEPLDDGKNYRVAMVNFLASGGDGYSMFKNITQEVQGVKDFVMLETYISKVSPVNIGVEGRLRYVSTDKNLSAPLLPSSGLVLLLACFMRFVWF